MNTTLGIRSEQPRGRVHDLDVADAERCFQHALQREQPVDVAGQVVEDTAVEAVHEGAAPVRPLGR
ncbi:MAG: hypothetical protein ACR2G2_11965 [Pseudonocardia sp.]